MNQLSPLIEKLKTEATAQSAINIPPIDFYPTASIKFLGVDLLVGECSYGRSVFNLTPALKIGSNFIIGEQIHKDWRQILSAKDTDTTWFVKLYAKNEHNNMIRYSLIIIDCPREQFLGRLIEWLNAKEK